MFTLPTTRSGTVKKIIHLADIHIRGSVTREQSRFDEYNQVFDRLINFVNQLKQEEKDSTIAIICGDIFHDKGRLSAYSIFLFNKLIGGLAANIPTMIFIGNHCNGVETSDTNVIDVLNPLLESVENVYFMNQIGHYVCNNVTFGFMPIHEILYTGSNAGLVNQEMKEFPKPSDIPDSQIKVACAHAFINRDFKIDFFGNYDICMLGDIHTMHVYNSDLIEQNIQMENIYQDIYRIGTFKKRNGKMAWAYSGSLLQQNHGETILGHGFITWDVENKDDIKAHMFHIKNDHGFVDLWKQENHWVLNINHPSFSNNFINLNNFINYKYLPTILNIRYKNTNEESCQVVDQLTTHLNNLGIICKKIKGTCIDNDYTHDIVETKVDDNITFNDTNIWTEYIQDCIKKTSTNIKHNFMDWVDNPHQLLVNNKYVESFHITTFDKNKKIQQCIDNYNASKNIFHANSKFQITCINFSYILCYGEENFIDFDTFNKKVTLIPGGNAIGKTALLEIICISLFGEGFPSRKHKSHSAAIVSINRPFAKRSHTNIVFNLNDKKYQLIRKYDVVDSSKLNQKDVTLKDLETNIIVLRGKATVDKWIDSNICDISAFLTSTMITQGFDFDFFDLKSQEQKQKIDDALCIKSSTCFKDLLHQSSLVYSSLKKELALVSSNLYTDRTNVDNKDYLKEINSIKSSIETEKENIKNYNQKLAGIDTRLLEMGKDKLEQEILNKEIKIKDYGNESTESVLSKKSVIEHELSLIGNHYTDKSIEALAADLVKIPVHNIPDLSEDFINNEIKRIKSIINNNEFIDIHENVLNEKHIYKKSLENEIIIINQNYLECIQNLQKHIQNKPEICSKSIEDYHEYRKRIDKYTEEYGSIQELPIVPIPDCRVPSMTHDDMCRYRKEINNYLSKLSINNIEELDLLYNENKSQQLLEKEKVLEKTLSNLKKSLKKSLDIKESNNDKLLKHLENKINCSKKVLKKDVNKLGKQFIDYHPNTDLMILESGLQIINNYIDLENKINNIQDLLQEYNNCEFNENCQACMKNPMRIKRESYTNKLEEYKRSLDSIQEIMIRKYGSIIDMQSYNMAYKRKNDYMEYIGLLDDYDQYIYTSKLERKWIKTNIDLENNLKDLKIFVEKTFQDIENVENELIVLKEDLNKEKYIIDSIQEFKNNYSNILSDLEWNETSIMLYNEYEQKRLKVESLRNDWNNLLSEKESLDTELELINDWEEWKQTESRFNEDITNVKGNLDDFKTKLNNCIQDLEEINRVVENNKNIKYLFELNEQLEKHYEINKRMELEKSINFIKLVQEKEKVDACSTCCKLRDEELEIIRSMNNAIVGIDTYNRLLKSQTRMNELNETLGSLQTEYNNFINVENEYSKKVEERNTIHDLIQEYSDMIITFDKIRDILGNFKTWLFENKAIPLLCRKVNNFLDLLTVNSRPIRLECEFVNDDLTWYLIDDNLKIILNKASGFQKLAISFSMRLALGKLGISGINSKQLFIDESFVYFDKNNLECIPEFLRAILSTYDQIFLVTHLSCLKESCNAFINIHRENGISLVNIDGDNKRFISNNNSKKKICDE